ncbi:MAG: polyphosphate polymerase domain-containing protein [Salinivirgaceae bacterium]|nr:polyphosphate polymerase domain-containing protein [Salinivirgaceae bacterium]
MDASFLNEVLNTFNPVSLRQLNHLKLMNRMDSKFVLPLEYLHPILEKASASYMVLEIENLRTFLYKTEYVDYPGLGLYLDHQNQRRTRFKIRYRTYPNSGFTFLEIKQKTNKGKTVKNRIEVPLDSRLTESDYSYIESMVPLKEKNLRIQTVNYFNRITLVSFETNERITIDYNLEMGGEHKKTLLPNIVIAEVKRELSNGNSPFLKTLKEFKIHESGFSKYCIGMALNNPALKQNSFKPQILHLKKLNYANTPF